MRGPNRRRSGPPEIGFHEQLQAPVLDKHGVPLRRRSTEKLRRTLQSAYCDRERIYEHQLVDLGDGSTLTQDLEYWNEGGAFRFKLYQNRRLTADVSAR